MAADLDAKDDSTKTGSSFTKALLSIAVAIFLSCGLGCPGSSETSSKYPSYWEKLPQSGNNNVWYEKNGSDTVLVFVHGFLSDSRQAWTYIDSKNRMKSAYWPELIKNDPRLEDPSIFLGGYFTAVDAGPYDTRRSPCCAKCGLAECAKWTGSSPSPAQPTTWCACETSRQSQRCKSRSMCVRQGMELDRKSLQTPEINLLNNHKR